MTKTLSQQICELCGLEYEKSIVDETYKRLCDHGDPRCTQISSTRKAKLDFENPENFVKLYELMIDEENTLTGFIIIILTHLESLLYIPRNRKSYLQVLLTILQEKSIQQKWIDKIKQSIRDYDSWVWG